MVVRGMMTEGREVLIAVLEKGEQPCRLVAGASRRQSVEEKPGVGKRKERLASWRRATTLACPHTQSISDCCYLQTCWCVCCSCTV